MTEKEFFCSREFRCWCSATTLYCYMTPCQPLTARTDDLYPFVYYLNFKTPSGKYLPRVKIIIIKRRFIRRSNMAGAATRAPYNFRCSYYGNSYTVVSEVGTREQIWCAFSMFLNFERMPVVDCSRRPNHKLSSLSSICPCIKWRRNEFEIGGTCPSRSVFWSCPSTFLALKVQFVVLVSAFVMASRVCSVSCLLFFGAPPCPAICKSGGTCLPPCPMESASLLAFLRWPPRDRFHCMPCVDHLYDVANRTRRVILSWHQIGSVIRRL